MKLLVTGTAIAGALMLGAAAPKPEKASMFAKEPTHAEAMALLSEAARKEGGYAAMRCKVTAAARLADCHVVQEGRPDLGFGRVLLHLAPEYRVKSPAEGGPAPDSEIVETFDGTHVDKPVDWKRKPSPNDLLVVWPKKAWAKGVGGEAIIGCPVSTQGALYDCVVISEKPEGENFGAAAIALTPQFLMTPPTLNGAPVVSYARIPLHFRMPIGTTPSPTLGDRAMIPVSMAWPEAPSYADVAAAYPKKAAEKKLGGRATVNCDFTKDGRLTGCDTVIEEPRGQGFADAAKVLAKRFRALTNDGPAPRASVQLPVVFDPAMLTAAKPVIGKAQWAVLPTADDLTAAFGKASRPGTSRVMIACVVQQGGRVDGCNVVREEPTGAGLGQAALTLAPHFRLSTWTAEGLPVVGGTVNIPLRYEGGAAPAASASPTPASARSAGPG
jgi:TonB family protein